MQECILLKASLSGDQARLTRSQGLGTPAAPPTYCTNRYASYTWQGQQKQSNGDSRNQLRRFHGVERLDS